MNKLSTYWTGAVAYLSLLVGAGLSVAGNLADTYRVRGDLVDAVDIALAVGPPLATLLVAELFVSQWPRAWSLQAVRWGGTITVGTLAMVVSWLHLSELLAARGQTALVAILWPLAIDGLAIMAMAKLLAMRGQVDSGHAAATPALVAKLLAKRGHGQSTVASVAKPAYVATEEDVAISEAILANPMDYVANSDVANWADDGHGHEGEDCPDAATPALLDVATVATGQPATMATSPLDTPTDWDAELAALDRAIDGAGHALAERVIEPGVAAAPVVTGVPAEARDLLAAWDPAVLSGPEVDALLAEHFGKTARTARRWRSMVRPTSA
jgi:hypothetical protein